MHNDFKGGFESVAIRYGRRLVLRGENEIMLEIVSAKSAGMPISHIEALQRELIFARYKNNRTELERQQLLADVEPLNGYEVTEIASLAQYVDDDALEIKYNFSILMDVFEQKNGPVQMYKPEQPWKVRVNAIYDKLKELKDEVLLISGESGQNGGQPIPGTEAD